MDHGPGARHVSPAVVDTLDSRGGGVIVAVVTLTNYFQFWDGSVFAGRTKHIAGPELKRRVVNEIGRQRQDRATSVETNLIACEMASIWPYPLSRPTQSPP